jgi:CarboxypepD_reg-like domain/TonB-dependent Receptor Plug Domain
MKKYILIFTCLVSSIMTFAQNTNPLSQKVKGIVIDADSKQPLPGATVQIKGTQKAVLADGDGAFKFEAVPVGIIGLDVSMVGYERKSIPEVTVNSGKEVFLTIALNEKISSLEEVTVVAYKDRIKPTNEFATVSARSLNLEDAKRYPAAISDPGRMAQNFAGVSASDDASNEIVVRGNSPQGVLWRLEGVEIPNPNHFAGIGAAGGAVSMLSSSTIGKSDFYTGAFPAEFGNASSGVFDLNYRVGNKDKTEFAINAGVIGVGAAAEGPFKKGGKSSYLINFRYSTFGLISSFINIQGQQLNYQDLNFKFNFPTSIGNFSLFGLVGNNLNTRTAKKEQTSLDFDVFNFKTTLSVFGLTHQIFLNKDSYIKTVIARSGLIDGGKFDRLIPTLNYIQRPLFNENTTDVSYRISSFYNNKLSSKSTLRVGAILSNLDFSFVNNQYRYVPTPSVETVLDIKGQTTYLQGYAQFKHRLSTEFTLNAGFHTSYLALNKTNSFEPRASISYNAPNSQTITFAAGIHAKPQPLSVYFFENVLAGGTRLQQNKNLKMTNATHFVLGYEKSFDNGIRFKAETYYQRLSNVPVEAKIGSGFSVINSTFTGDLTNIDPLVNQGTGTNFGIDINIEKSFSNNYYYIANLSLYRSKYTTFDQKEFDTRFNRQYQLNLVGGKEWSIGRKNRILGINGKVLTTGGVRENEIDFTASRAAGETILVPNKFFTQVNDPYFRFDLGISLKTNRKKATHTVSLDIQNLTDRRNGRGVLFDPYGGPDNLGGKTIGDGNAQLGRIPLLNYKLEF